MTDMSEMGGMPSNDELVPFFESSPVCVVRGGVGVVAGFFLCAGMKGAFSC